MITTPFTTHRYANVAGDVGRATYDPSFSRANPWCIFVDGSHVVSKPTLAECDAWFRERHNADRGNAS